MTSLLSNGPKNCEQHHGAAYSTESTCGAMQATHRSHSVAVHTPAMQATHGSHGATIHTPGGTLQGYRWYIHSSNGKPQSLLPQTSLQNYWTPLASQVKELDKVPPRLNLLHSIQQHPPCCVTFALSPSHIEKDAHGGNRVAHTTGVQHFVSTPSWLSTTCTWAS